MRVTFSSPPFRRSGLAIFTQTSSLSGQWQAGVHSLFESCFEQQKTALKLDCVTDYDAISLPGSEDIALDSVNEESAIKPPNEAEMPTNEAIKPPNEATKPPNDKFKLEHRRGMLWPRRFCLILETPQGFFLILGKEFPSETKLWSSPGCFGNEQCSLYWRSSRLDPTIINQISSPQSR